MKMMSTMWTKTGLQNNGCKAGELHPHLAGPLPAHSGDVFGGRC
jgi:hypothetical protein